MARFVKVTDFRSKGFPNNDIKTIHSPIIKFNGSSFSFYPSDFTFTARPSLKKPRIFTAQIPKSGAEFFPVSMKDRCMSIKPGTMFSPSVKNSVSEGCRIRRGIFAAKRNLHCDAGLSLRDFHQ